MFHVYIIEGVNKWMYCGISGKIVQRIQDHNKGKSKSTRKHLPYILKFLYETDSRIKARLIEKKIKNFGVRKFYTKLQFSNNYEKGKNWIEEGALPLN
jgi:putative endonuclease